MIASFLIRSAKRGLFPAAKFLATWPLDAAVAIGLLYLVFARTPALPIVRDAAVASYAHWRAGERIRFGAADAGAVVPIDGRYARAAVLAPNATWGIQGNSIWATDKTRLIVPMFAYEGLNTQPITPDMVAFFPFPSFRSLVVAGTVPNDGVILLNERYAIDPNPRWDDQRAVLETLVHELIHIQGGKFVGRYEISINGGPWEPLTPRVRVARTDVYEVRAVWGSVEFESHTAAATVEVLAALCNLNDRIACGAFWDQLSGSAALSLKVRLHELGVPDAVYNTWAELYIRDRYDRSAAEKSNRFWMNGPGTPAEYWSIADRYYRYPWEDKILPGVCGQRLDTGISAPIAGGMMDRPTAFSILGLKFDDTSRLMGPLALVCHITG